jgi:hypothetical protein
MHPPDLKSHMIREVNSDLVRVVDVIVHFIEYDQGLDEMSYEAGRWRHS